MVNWAEVARGRHEIGSGTGFFGRADNRGSDPRGENTVDFRFDYDFLSGCNRHMWWDNSGCARDA